MLNRNSKVCILVLYLVAIMSFLYYYLFGGTSDPDSIGFAFIGLELATIPFVAGFVLALLIIWSFKK